MCDLEYVAITDSGKKRKINQDNIYVNGQYKKEIDASYYKIVGKCSNGKILAAVCDGMGGEAFGEVASLYAVEELVNIQKHHKKVTRNIWKEYIESANERICNDILRINQRMGTTVAAIQFNKRSCVVMNVGDSRVYRFQGETLEQLSYEHSVIAGLIRDGLLTLEESTNHPMRHQITQHLGLFSEEMVLEPYISHKYMLKDKDIYLICSDGLTDMLTDDEINEHLRTDCTLEEKAEQLLKHSIQNGGKDNISIILISVCRLKNITGCFDKSWIKLKNQRKTT